MGRSGWFGPLADRKSDFICKGGMGELVLSPLLEAVLRLGHA